MCGGECAKGRFKVGLCNITIILCIAIISQILQYDIFSLLSR